MWTQRRSPHVRVTQHSQVLCGHGFRPESCVGAFRAQWNASICFPVRGCRGAVIPRSVFLTRLSADGNSKMGQSGRLPSALGLTLVQGFYSDMNSAPNDLSLIRDWSYLRAVHPWSESCLGQNLQAWVIWFSGWYWCYGNCSRLLHPVSITFSSSLLSPQGTSRERWKCTSQHHLMALHPALKHLTSPALMLLRFCLIRAESQPSEQCPAKINRDANWVYIPWHIDIVAVNVICCLARRHLPTNVFACISTSYNGNVCPMPPFWSLDD